MYKFIVDSDQMNQQQENQLILLMKVINYSLKNISF